MAAIKFKELDIVKYNNPAAVEESHPHYGTGLDALYGIVRDSFEDVIYVEFFLKTKTLGVEARSVDMMTKVGSMYDLIKKGSLPTPAPTVIYKEKIVREKVAKEPKAKKEKVAKAAPVEVEVVAETTTVEASTSNKLHGIRILPTGLFTRFSRQGFVDNIIANGGIYGSGGVNKKLDILVVGKAAGPAKINKARELGIKMITEDEYIAMIS
jgi:NAD-dependent DNA ligase